MESHQADQFETNIDGRDIIEPPLAPAIDQQRFHILLHDFHKHTAEALPELLHRLKAGGYKVVKMIAKAPVQTIAQYDDEILKDAKLPTVSSRPVSSVVQTISE